MSLFLFHVLNLRRVVPPADLLLVVWLLIWLLIVFCAWLVLGARIFSLHDRSRAAKTRVYRHLWDSLEKLYRELGDGEASNDALRTLFREAYAFFLSNARVIEAGDRVVFGRYIHALQCLRFVNGQEGSVIGKVSPQTSPWSLEICAMRANEATQLRSAVWQRVCHILRSG
jgi:hypothetical protein